MLVNTGMLALTGAAVLGVAAPCDAVAAESPGLEAIEEFRGDAPPRKAVENRFFLKQERFEIAPILGYVPNNPFARRYLGGAIVGYHLSESISLQVAVAYSPDLGEGDLKGLTGVLLERSYSAPDGETEDGEEVAQFQQPLDKVGLYGAFGVAWSPLYGKINLVGETVLNFDFYFFAGAGMVSKSNYVAEYDEVGATTTGDVVNLVAGGSEVKVSPYLGIGQNYFLSQSLALKIDIRSAFYVDNKPQYDPEVAVTEQRLYNNVMANVGVAVFFPKMKPRLYNF